MKNDKNIKGINDKKLIIKKYEIIKRMILKIKMKILISKVL